jgi:hypothetical protein
MARIVRASEILLRPIEPSDQAEARELILAGLEEHWGFRDASKNSDLAEICTSYAGATFLVACEGDRARRIAALIEIDRPWAAEFWTAVGYPRDDRVIRHIRMLD